MRKLLSRGSSFGRSHTFKLIVDPLAAIGRFWRRRFQPMDPLRPSRRLAISGGADDMDVDCFRDLDFAKRFLRPLRWIILRELVG